MFANLDYYCGMAIAWAFAILAALCGVAALYGWVVVLFTVPTFWQSVQIHGNPHSQDWLAIAVYLCPWGAWICGWLALRCFMGR